MSQDGTPDGSAPTAPSARVRWLRGDVDGLRAVAIVLVVLFHAGVPALSNGFIGVDVFFVISGYLITRNLLRDTADGTRVGLLDFWARRLRRLVPALALVVATTLVLSVLVLPTFQLRDTAVQGMAAALYVSNLLFASQSQGYFAEDVETSPFLHTWSLGIEEQFYLFWPVLFVAAALLARRWWPDRLRAVLVAGFAVTLVGSMGVNVWLTAEQSPWAFYGLPARAWEFAAAGLLAALPVGALVRRRAVGAGLAVVGLALLVVALAAIPDDAVYPGWWAVLPVAATIALILAGTPHATDGGTNPVSGAMGIRPLQWLGRLSYSWYLWHWPAMILAVAWWGEDTVQLRLVAGGASLAVAWVAYRFVENPVRFSRPLMASLGRTYALALLATLVVVGVAAVVRRVPQADPDDGGLAAQVLEARDSWRHTYCSTRPTIAGVTTCVNGDVDAERDLLVLGDSHGAQWKPAIDAWGEANGVRVVEDIRFACPAIGVPVTNRRGDEDNQADCAAAWDERRRLIDELRPEVVLVAQWQGYLDRIIDDDGSSPPVADRLERWRAAYEDLVATVAAADAGLVAVLDEPELEDDPLACIDRQRALDPCAVPREEALARIAPLRSVEVAVLAGYGGLPRLDMVERLCDDQRCAVGLSGTVAYADRQHLTEAFVTENGAWLADLLSEAMAGGPPVAGSRRPRPRRRPSTCSTPSWRRRPAATGTPSAVPRRSSPGSRCAWWATRPPSGRCWSSATPTPGSGSRRSTSWAGPRACASSST